MIFIYFLIIIHRRFDTYVVVLWIHYPQNTYNSQWHDEFLLTIKKGMEEQRLADGYVKIDSVTKFLQRNS